MFGRRFKQLVNVSRKSELPEFIGLPKPSYSDSSIDSDRMPPRTMKPIVTEAPTYLLAPG